MTGRFVVNKELLELSIEANQNLEMSENLDDDEDFKTTLTSSLARLNRKEIKKVRYRKSMTGAEQIENMINMQKAENSSQQARVMDSDWMNMKLNM